MFTPEAPPEKTWSQLVIENLDKALASAFVGSFGTYLWAAYTMQVDLARNMFFAFGVIMFLMHMRSLISWFLRSINPPPNRK